MRKSLSLLVMTLLGLTATAQADYTPEQLSKLLETVDERQRNSGAA